MPNAAQRSTAPSMPRRMAAPRASSASRRARRARSRSGQLEPPERLTVPTSVSPSPSQPSALGSVPLSRASGSRVNTGLRASMGPTIEMSPRALARASRAFMLMARNDDAMMAGQTQSGAEKRAPVKRKKASQARADNNWPQATMTSAGITRPRPLMTANWAAWVKAAPSESGNKVTRAGERALGNGRWDFSGTRGLADTLPDGLSGVNRGRAEDSSGGASGDDALEVIWTAGGENDGSTRWQGSGGHRGRHGDRSRGVTRLGRGGRARGGQRLWCERRRQPALQRAREPGR